MASQQPRPPWFRFSSVASRAPTPPAPPRAPAPAPAPTPIRPSFPTQTQEPIPPPPPPPPPPPSSAPQPSPHRTPASSQARSPVTQPARPSPPPAPTPETKSSPTSPIQKEVLKTSPYAPPEASDAAALTTGKVNGKANTPLSSPKTIKPLSRPPSPLTLPTAQLNSDQPMTEQRTILVQQNADKPLKMPIAHNNGIASSGKGEPTSKHKKLISDSEELGIKVITLAGENKGSVMGFSPQSLHKNKGTKSESSNGDQSSSGEGKSRNKDHANGGTTMQSYFNSNVQGLNNSIVCNTTFRNNDPGIHLSLRKPNSGRSKD